jgi:hypothetical protein
LFDEFPVKKWSATDALSPLFFNFAVGYTILNVRSRKAVTEWDTSASGILL